MDAPFFLALQTGSVPCFEIHHHVEDADYVGLLCWDVRIFSCLGVSLALGVYHKGFPTKNSSMPLSVSQMQVVMDSLSSPSLGTVLYRC